MMRFQMSLLEYLSYRSQSDKLSDLHALNGPEISRVLQALERISPEDVSLREWNDALAYLTGDPSQATCETARERLILSLTARNNGFQKSRRGVETLCK